MNATAINFGLTIAGDVASFGDALQERLTQALKTSLNCVERDGCFLKARVSTAASINVAVVLTILDAAPAGSAASAADTVTAVQQAATTLVAQPTTSLSASLGVSVQATTPVKVRAGVTRRIVVAPPPPPLLPPFLPPDAIAAGTVASIATLVVFIAVAIAVAGAFKMGMIGPMSFTKVKVLPSKSREVPTTPTDYSVADTIFDVVAGRGAKTISLKKLTAYMLREHKDMTLERVQVIFSQLDTNGDGNIDRTEWNIGFTKGLIPGDGSAKEETPNQVTEF